MFRGVWSLGGRTKTGRMYLLPVKREYQYFLNKERYLWHSNEIFFLLVTAAEDKVE